MKLLTMAGIGVGALLLTRLVSAKETPDECVRRYAGADGIVQRSESLQAAVDYFAGKITKECAIAVKLAYCQNLGATDPDCHE